jgi:hypothetical protein
MASDIVMKCRDYLDVTLSEIILRRLKEQLKCIILKIVSEALSPWLSVEIC